MKTGRLHYLPFICLGLIYLLFPTQNANIDSWYYAASAKYGQNLIHSHHLLYNFLGRYWYLLLCLFNPHIEAISALNIMNALAATGSLFICYRIFLQLDIENRTALWLTVTYGSCFGFMRYATDAETYILPLLCSLASTCYFLMDKLLPAALFSVLAILIHELHICWALAMFITLVLRRPFSFKQLLLFAIPFLIIPAAYYIAYSSLKADISFSSFISGEYATGNAGLNLSLTSLVLTAINFIRSFVQVHGLISALLDVNIILVILPLLVTLAAIIYLLVKRSFKMRINKKTDSRLRPWSRLFLLAFLLHLVFAMLSNGNAEFMVMLPFLFIAFLYTHYDFKVRGPLPFIAISIFIWNCFIGIFPKHFYDIDRVDKQAAWTSTHPKAYFLWKHKPLVENVLTYREGFGTHYNFIRLDDSTQYILDSLIQNHIPVYTDYSNPRTDFSREEMVSRNSYAIGRYYFIPVTEWVNLYGHNEINLISKKGD